MTLLHILYSNNWYPENKLSLLQLITNKITNMEYILDKCRDHSDMTIHMNDLLP